MIGQMMESALWYNADKPEDRESARKGVIRAFFTAGDYSGVQFGPITWEEVDPTSPRVPTPPAYMKGNVKALIGSAVVIAHRIEIPQSALAEDLTPTDRAHLRKATRIAFMKAGGFTLTDEECDSLINEYGPDVAWAEVMSVN